MTDIERLKTTQEQLGEQWDLAAEKWRRLRKAYLLETREEEKIRLEPQIAEAEKARTQIEAQLAQLERDLRQADLPAAEPRAEPLERTATVTQIAGAQSNQINQARDVTITR